MFVTNGFFHGNQKFMNHVNKTREKLSARNLASNLEHWKTEDVLLNRLCMPPAARNLSLAGVI
jgi:hypothetical protein